MKPKRTIKPVPTSGSDVNHEGSTISPEQTVFLPQRNEKTPKSSSSGSVSRLKVKVHEKRVVWKGRRSKTSKRSKARWWKPELGDMGSNLYYLYTSILLYIPFLVLYMTVYL